MAESPSTLQGKGQRFDLWSRKVTLTLKQLKRCSTAAEPMP